MGEGFGGVDIPGRMQIRPEGQTCSGKSLSGRNDSGESGSHSESSLLLYFSNNQKKHWAKKTKNKQQNSHSSLGNTTMFTGSLQLVSDLSEL